MSEKEIIGIKDGKLHVCTGVNFKFLLDNYNPNSKDKQGFCHEGSGGSGKTYDILHFILFVYCEIHANKGKDILITRETYSECKKTVMKDFFKILKFYGLYDSKLHVESHPQQYKYKGNTISFSGLDDSSSHGERRNLIYFNELLLSNDNKAYLQLQGRCSEVFIADWNPIFTIHWVYDTVQTRSDTKFFHSTFLTNPYLPKGERDEKLGYEPTPENIKNGTADEYMWNVYGRGIRASREGVIFKYVKYIDEFPEDVDYFYGLDFGYTSDETALAKIYIDEAKKELYAECLMYECTENPMLINDYFNSIGIEKFVPIIADSSDKYISQTKGAVEFVKDLKHLGWNISKVSKTHDRYYWIGKAKEYKMFIVASPQRPVLAQATKREYENFSWRVINGVQVNQPIDKFDHFISAKLYAMMGNKKSQSKGTFWN